MRPVVRGPDPGPFTKYGDALPALRERMGWFCSYCERKLPVSLAVEHVRPKSVEDHLELTWDNFLLACTNCNSVKGATPVELLDYYWPDVDNTCIAVDYGGGRVRPAAGLTPEQRAIAERSLALTGLDRRPGGPAPAAKDERWLQRLVAFRKAQEAQRRLSEDDSAGHRETIAEWAVDAGFWSIWMLVFRDDDDMKQRLVDGFPGTAVECFDADDHLNPVARPGGAL